MEQKTRGKFIFLNSINDFFFFLNLSGLSVHLSIGEVENVNFMLAYKLESASVTMFKSHGPIPSPPLPFSLCYISRRSTKGGGHTWADGNCSSHFPFSLEDLLLEATMCP